MTVRIRIDKFANPVVIQQSSMIMYGFAVSTELDNINTNIFDQSGGVVAGGIANEVYLEDPLGNSLREDLVAYYRFSDVSDSGPNELDLTNVGATFTSGKIGDAATFVGASSQRLTIAHNELFEIGNSDYTVAIWAKVATGGNAIIFSKEENVGVGRSYELYVYPDLTVGWFVRRGDNADFVETTPRPTLVADTWAWLVVDHDATANTIGIRFNNGSRTSTAFPDGGAYEGGQQLGFGWWPNGGGANFLTGQLDEALFIPRLLTVDELAYLYNSGNGRSLY